MRRTTVMGAVLGAMTLMGAGAVQARGLGAMFFDAGLSQTDIAAMETAGQQLLEPLGRTGDARRWNNSRSRASGTVTLGRIEGQCAELAHRFSTKRRPEPATFRIWRCRTADGAWQISPGPN